MKTYRKNRIVKFLLTHAYTKNLAVVSEGFFLSSEFVVQKNDYRKKRIVKFLLTHASPKNLAVVPEGLFSSSEFVVQKNDYRNFEIFISLQTLFFFRLIHRQKQPSLSCSISSLKFMACNILILNKLSL